MRTLWDVAPGVLGATFEGGRAVMFHVRQCAWYVKMMPICWLGACWFDAGDRLVTSSTEESIQASTHPGAGEQSDSDDQDAATEAWMPKSMWQAVVRGFVPHDDPDRARHAVTAWARTCRQTQGDWHDAFLRCQCDAEKIFEPNQGCVEAPPLLMTDTDCPKDFRHAPARCMRSLQAGPLAWHFAFQRHRGLLKVLQQQPTPRAWPLWSQNTMTLPAPDAQISLHVSNQPERHKGALARWSDNDFTLEPAQYTQMMTVFAQSNSKPSPANYLVACEQRLAAIATLPSLGRTILCQSVQDALEHLQNLPECLTQTARPTYGRVTWLQTASVSTSRTENA